MKVSGVGVGGEWSICSSCCESAILAVVRGLWQGGFIQV